MKRQDARDARGLREPDVELDGWARQVVAAALEVHRTLGPGFLESIYEEALCIELTRTAVLFSRQVPVTVRYKGKSVGHGQLDLLVGDRLIVELKAVEALAPIHGVQLRSYLKATGLTLGLLINFNVPLPAGNSPDHSHPFPSPVTGVLASWRFVLSECPRR